MWFPNRILRHLVLALAFAAVSPLSAAVQDAADELLMPDFYRAQDALFVSHLIDSFERSESAGGEWDDAVRELAELAAKTYNRRGDRIDPSRLNARALILARRGCTHLIPLLAMALADDEHKNNPFAIHKYEAIMQKVAEGEYLHPGTVMIIAHRLAELHAEERNAEAAQANFKLAAENYIEFLQATPHDRLSQRLALSMLPRGTGAALITQLDGKNLDAVTWETLQGLAHSDIAWAARGDGPAHSVTEDGWRRFREHMRQARRHFIAAHEADPSRPEAAERMIGIIGTGYGEGGETMEQWLIRARQAQVDWSRAYQSYLNFSQPRWGGTHEQMISFARACLNMERFDTLIPHRVLDVYRMILDDHDGDHSAIGGMDLFPMVRTALKGMIDHPNHAARKAYYQSVYIIAAWAAGDYAAAAQLLPDLPDLPAVDEAFKQFFANRSVVTDQVRIYASPVASEFRAAEKLLEERNWDRAIDAFSRLVQETPRPLQPIVQGRLTTAHSMKQFEAGEWVTFEFRNLAAWHIGPGRWETVRGDRSAVTMAHSPDMAFMISTMDVGSRWELRVEIDMSGARGHNWVDGGIVLGVDHHRNSAHAQFIAVRPHTNSLCIGFRRGGMWRGEFLDFPRPIGSVYHLHVVSWDDEVAVMNGEDQVFKGSLPRDDRLQRGGHFGLGGVHGWQSGVVVYRNLSIRKLAQRPDILVPR